MATAIVGIAVWKTGSGIISRLVRLEFAGSGVNYPDLINSTNFCLDPPG